MKENRKVGSSCVTLGGKRFGLSMVCGSICFLALIAGGQQAQGEEPSYPSNAHAIAAPVNAVHVSCQNKIGDAALIQNALGSSKAVAVNGHCRLDATTLALDSDMFLGGTAKLEYAGKGYAIQSSGNNNTISGLTFDGGGINLNLNDQAAWKGQYGWRIEGNTFINVVNGTSAIYVSNIIGKGAPSSFSFNDFKNIWPGGYPNFPTGNSADNCGQDCLLGNGSGGSGIWVEMGLDNVKINYNTFELIGSNAIKGFWDGFVGHIAPYEGHNVEISHNVMTKVHRIGIEVQTAGKGVCPGGCDYSRLPSDGTIIKDNFFHDPAFPADPFGLSLMVGGTNVQILNNTTVAESPKCYWPLGIALENTMNGGLAQGNVMSAVYQECSGDFNKSHGWAGMLVSGYTTKGYIDNFFNNVACGDSVAGPVLIGDDPENHATMNEQADYGTKTCPADPASTHIWMEFTSANDRKLNRTDSGTFSLRLASKLSIQFVEFFLDGAQKPFATQEIQDFNPEFSKDRLWLYHADVKLADLRTGKHAVTAVATDVAGGKQSIAQSFDLR